MKNIEAAIPFLLGCLILILAASSETVAEDGQQTARTRRQTTARAVGSTSNGQQVGAAMATAVGTSTRQPAGPPKSTSPENNPDEERQPPVRPPLRSPSRPPRRKQSRPMDDDSEEYRYSRGDEEETDCDEDQDTYGGGMFESMAANPMRHFRRMMNSVLDRFPSDFGFYRGDDDRYGGQQLGDPGMVSSAAAASFDSRDGGYSKLSSSVTNNGRVRGIISETRNGRTKTRRIGGDDDQDE